MTKPKEIKIYLEDCHDGQHTVTTSTLDYWKRLIAPAVKGQHPIDGGTVDTSLLDPLIENGKAVKSIPAKAEYVVPLV